MSAISSPISADQLRDAIDALASQVHGLRSQVAADGEFPATDPGPDLLGLLSGAGYLLDAAVDAVEVPA